MNTERLQNVIKESGLKHKFIADSLNISENLFAQKLLGNCKWKLDEVNILRSTLKLSKKDAYEIFFT